MPRGQSNGSPGGFVNHSTPPANRHKILVVDDEPAILRMLDRVLTRAGFSVTAVNNGLAAITEIDGYSPDLIIIDYMMPKLDGFQIISRLKNDPQWQNIPIIMMTAYDNVQNHVRAFDCGADEFLPKTANPSEIVARIRYHIRVKVNKDNLLNTRDDLEKIICDQSDQLKEASNEIIWRLAAASEYRDNETGTHIRRMAHYSAAIARAMGLPDKISRAILSSAPMHDIGKIGIPDSILLKPGKLTEKEWEIMRMHPIIGAKILEGSNIGIIKMGKGIALTHHERWDGKGYPNGLKETQIALPGRVVALADVFDALTTERPYKPAFSIERSLQIISEESGKQFDPDVVAAFFAIIDEILEIKAEFKDEGLSLLYDMDRKVNGDSRV